MFLVINCDLRGLRNNLMHRSAPMIVLVAVMTLYVVAYFHCPVKLIEILQTDLKSLSDEQLLSKRPLIIIDRVIHHIDMIKRSAFRLLHVKSVLRSQSHRGSLARTLARFTLLFHSISEKVHVTLIHPSSLIQIRIVLYRNQTLVLPPRWQYMCDDIMILELHDCVSACLALVCGLVNWFLRKAASKQRG